MDMHSSSSPAVDPRQWSEVAHCILRLEGLEQWLRPGAAIEVSQALLELRLFFKDNCRLHAAQLVQLNHDLPLAIVRCKPVLRQYESFDLSARRALFYLEQVARNTRQYTHTHTHAHTHVPSASRTHSLLAQTPDSLGSSGLFSGKLPSQPGSASLANGFSVWGSHPLSAQHAESSTPASLRSLKALNTVGLTDGQFHSRSEELLSLHRDLNLHRDLYQLEGTYSAPSVTLETSADDDVEFECKSDGAPPAAARSALLPVPVPVSVSVLPFGLVPAWTVCTRADASTYRSLLYTVSQKLVVPVLAVLHAVVSVLRVQLRLQLRLLDVAAQSLAWSILLAQVGLILGALVAAIGASAFLLGLRWALLSLKSGLAAVVCSPVDSALAIMYASLVLLVILLTPVFIALTTLSVYFLVSRYNLIRR